MNTDKRNLQQLRMKHSLLKSKMRSAVYGGTFDDEFFSTRGPISQWFSTSGFPVFSNYNEMEAMSRVHNEMNNIARRLHSMYKSGRLEEARLGLKDVERQSEEFLRLLTQLEEKV